MFVFFNIMFNFTSATCRDLHAIGSDLLRLVVVLESDDFVTKILTHTLMAFLLKKFSPKLRFGAATL